MSKKQTRRAFTKEFKIDVVNQSDACENIADLATGRGPSKRALENKE